MIANRCVKMGFILQRLVAETANLQMDAVRNLFQALVSGYQQDPIMKFLMMLLIPEQVYRFSRGAVFHLFNKGFQLGNLRVADIVQGQLAIKRIKTDKGRSIGSIQVEVEETLGHYAEWLEVPASEIRRLNGLRFGRPLRVNQAIEIPLRRVTKDDFEEKRFEFHKKLAEDFFASFRVEKVETYTVRRGDSIWTISKEKFDVPLWLIKKYNVDLDFSALFPSQKLLIPIIEKLRLEGKTIIMIEHRLKELFRIADRVLVLNYGEKIAEETS